MTFDLDLDIEHTLDAGLPGDHRVQVWSRSGHLPGRRSDFRAGTKVPVSRDPWPWPWAQPGCTLTWSPSCESLVAIRPFACECEKKRFAQKFTDGRTDGQTTDAAPLQLAHSWNELKMAKYIKCFMRHCVYDGFTVSEDSITTFSNDMNVARSLSNSWAYCFSC